MLEWLRKNSQPMSLISTRPSSTIHCGICSRMEFQVDSLLVQAILGVLLFLHLDTKRASFCKGYDSVSAETISQKAHMHEGTESAATFTLNLVQKRMPCPPNTPITAQKSGLCYISYMRSCSILLLRSDLVCRLCFLLIPSSLSIILVPSKTSSILKCREEIF